MPTIPEIPKEKVSSKKGYYHGVYVILHFNKEGILYREEEQDDLEQDTDEEDI